jgi:O-antigen ligase
LTILFAAGLGAAAAAGGPRVALMLFGGLLAMAVGVVALNRPDAALPGLVVTAFVVPLEIAASESVAVNVVVAAVPLLCAFWLLRKLRLREPLVLDRRVSVAMLGLLVVATLGWALGNLNWDQAYPRPAGLLAVQAGQWAIFAVSVAAFFLGTQQSPRALTWFTWAFLGLGVVVLLGRYGGPLAAVFRPIVAAGADGNGIFYVWFTAMAGGQGLFNHRLNRKLRALLLVLAAATPILGFAFNTQWSTSWLPPLFVLVILVWLRSQRGSLLVLLALTVGMIAFSGFILDYYDWELEREISIGGRFELWESVWNLALQRPILGLGLTNYHHYHRFIPLLTDHGAWYEPNVNSHNLYLDLFAQLGLVGVMVFGWAMVQLASLGGGVRRLVDPGSFAAGYANGALAGLAGTLLASIIVEWFLPFVYNVGFPGLRFSALSWVFLGGLVALRTAHGRGVDADAN